MEYNADIKAKVDLIVKNYIKNCRPEFDQFRKEQKSRREQLITKWSELKGHDGVVMRELNRMPETLFALLKVGLTDSEYIAFREQKMQFWFGNSYPDFKMTEGRL